MTAAGTPGQEPVSSPAVDALRMAAARSRTTARRGLGRRPKIEDPPAEEPRDEEVTAPVAAVADAGSAVADAGSAVADAGPAASDPGPAASGPDPSEHEPGEAPVASDGPGVVAGAAGAGWRRWFGAARSPDGRRNWLGSKQVAAVVLLLLAAEIGYIVHLNTSSNSAKTSSPPPLSSLPQLKAPPAASTPTTVPAPATAPATSPPSTVPGASAVAAPVPVQTVSAPLGPCTAGDLDIVTTTGHSAYAVGQDVNMTTTVTDVHSCIFQPAPAGTYGCAASLVISSGGNQVWPAPGQAEPCNAPGGMTMNPGSTESLSATWAASATGTYEAVGEWGWSGASGQPTNTANVASAPFTVS
jgi:hypothetical protein